MYMNCDMKISYSHFCNGENLNKILFSVNNQFNKKPQMAMLSNNKSAIVSLSYQPFYQVKENIMK